ncbi:phosphodiester glycosidase family protein [Brasilonema bromeliae]|uniref:Phosphodiester glycosidase family protein n=1 Tax=Brasilonema bromeliae SPC951 TaxID=385972 RepID=A0ABX1PAB9_9CYAN|nr:phosphodiester glycosidase family protein [Brasilonema bromeliae]NMG21404.1 phosphodiester glycosidase family protein [Brasilonema bromeliae SPC951]
MRKIWILAGVFVSATVLLLFFRTATSKETNLITKTIKYEQRNLPNSIVHILNIPSGSQFVVTPALSSQLNTVEEFAKQHQAVAIINAGFFDPVNQKTTSIIFQQGKLIANPKDNERLVNNPDLKPYLNKILNRAEFRRYLCEQTVRYSITLHSEPLQVGCQLVDALGGGPQLLPELTSVQEGFVDNANRRDALGSTKANARTAIGITGDGTIVLVMVAQKPDVAANSGMSLPELARFMQTLAVEKAMNLDGGSSSSLYYDGKTFYGKVDSKGNLVKRPVKSVLIVQETLGDFK